MDPRDVPQLVALVILLMLSAFFSSAETSLISVNQIRMRSLAENGNARAKRVLAITSNQSKMLSAILIGNNIVNISASALATMIAQKIWGNAAVSIATGVLTVLVLIFGEISPKTLATANADKLALAFSGPIRILMIVLTPFIIVINFLAKGVLRILGYKEDKNKTSFTEDELRTIVEVSHEEGVLENDEREMINNVFDFGESQAKDVMIPRIDMTCISIDSTFDEIVEVFRKDKYTRLPVYETSVDNVIGIINVKDLLLCEDKKSFSVQNILRKPYYTYEYKKISELMEELKKTSNNFTIIVDEYGSTVGMITLEDLLEEIVGEIRDEYDEDEVDDILQINENEYLILGTTRLNELEDLVDLPDSEEEDDYDTVGGFIVSQLGRLPQTGDEITVNNLRFVVDECDKYRIINVHLYITPEGEKSEESDANKEE